jgi:outer membrane protein, heavy metal efflux system
LQSNAMNFSVFQLLDVLRDRQLAEMDAITARRDYWTATAARDALLAGQRVESAPEAAMPRGDTRESAGGH